MCTVCSTLRKGGGGRDNFFDHADNRCLAVPTLITFFVCCAQKFFQSGVAEDAASYMTIEWTNQHACGGNEDSDPHKPNCNLVIQYMVQSYDGDQGGMLAYYILIILINAYIF